MHSVTLAAALGIAALISIPAYESAVAAPNPALAQIAGDGSSPISRSIAAVVLIATMCRVIACAVAMGACTGSAGCAPGIAETGGPTQNQSVPLIWGAFLLLADLDFRAWRGILRIFTRRLRFAASAR